MKAQDLVGQYAIRVRPVILSEEESIMDDCFMGKPGFIVKYNYEKDYIVIDDEDGNTMILSNDYNDDNWQQADSNTKTYKPVGYKSVYPLYDKIAKESKKKHQEKMNERPNVHCGLDLRDCIVVLGRYLNEHNEVVFQYDSPYTGYGVDDPFISRMYDVGDAYTLKSFNGKPDIIFKNCPEFSEAVTKLHEHNVDVINTIYVIPLALHARFGYSAINNYGKTDKLYIIAASGTFVANIDSMIKIRRINIMDMMPVLLDMNDEKDADTIILSSNESADILGKIENRCDSSGVYRCNKLDFG